MQSNSALDPADNPAGVNALAQFDHRCAGPAQREIPQRHSRRAYVIWKLRRTIGPSFVFGMAPDDETSRLRQMIERAHEKGIKVYSAT